MTAAEWSQSLVRAVEVAAQSVVRVDAGPRRSRSGTVWSADGLVITSAYHLDADETIEVAFDSGEQRKAALVGKDPETDIAVLRVEGSSLTPLSFVSSADARVGQAALALGRPGKSVRASLRIIGVLGNDVRTPLGGRLDRYIETDRALPRGFSGGPLVDLEGRAIGMDTRALMRGADLAVPRETIERVVAELVTHGGVRRGYLGVGAYPVRLPGNVASALSRQHGALIVGVEDSSPAAAAGLLLGDVLVELDGEPVRGPGDLRALLFERPGQKIAGRVLRAGSLTEFSVTAGARTA